MTTDNVKYGVCVPAVLGRPGASVTRRYLSSMWVACAGIIIGEDPWSRDVYAELLELVRYYCSGPFE